MITRVAMAGLGAAALLAAGAGTASAGEITGNGKPVPGPQHAASVCSYSGLNDEPDDPEHGGRVQSYGQLVSDGAIAPQVFNPGDACNPNAGGAE